MWVNEGDAGATFTLRLSEQSLTPVTLIWGLDSGTAGYNSDFTGVTNQTLTFDPGQLEQTIFVPLLSDTSIEGPQTFRVVLQDPSGGTLLRNAGNAIIVDDDTVSGFPRISVSDTVVDETGTANVIVRLDAASTSTVSVGYTTVTDSAEAGSDFTASSQLIMFNPGEVVKTVAVSLLDNGLAEPTERFFVQLGNASGGQIAQSRATVTVFDNDTVAVASPFISVDDVWVSESDDYATFTVSLSGRSAGPVSMTWGLDSQTAGYNSDFLGFTNQVLTFAPGEVTKSIRVPILENTTAEGLEAMRVILSTAVGGTFAKAEGSAVIVDNDAAVVAAPNITVDDVVVDESRDASVVVRLDAPSASTISVNYVTANGTAVGGSDFAADSVRLPSCPVK